MREWETHLFTHVLAAYTYMPIRIYKYMLSVHLECQRCTTCIWIQYIIWIIAGLMNRTYDLSVRADNNWTPGVKTQLLKISSHLGAPSHARFSLAWGPLRESEICIIRRMKYTCTVKCVMWNNNHRVNQYAYTSTNDEKKTNRPPSVFRVAARYLTTLKNIYRKSSTYSIYYSNERRRRTTIQLKRSSEIDIDNTYSTQREEILSRWRR